MLELVRLSDGAEMLGWAQQQTPPHPPSHFAGASARSLRMWRVSCGKFKNFET